MKKFYEFQDEINNEFETNYKVSPFRITAVGALNKFIEDNPTIKIVSTQYSVIYVCGHTISYPMTSILVEVEE